MLGFGLPVANLLVNLSAAAMIGGLALAVFALPRPSRGYGAAAQLAAVGAASFTLAAATSGLLAFLSATALPLSADEVFGRSLALFVSSVPLGQAWLAATVLGAVTTVLCVAVRNQTALLLVLVLAAAALVAVAQQGHPGGTGDHAQTVTALILHVLFAALWLGGLLAVVVLRPLLDPESVPAVFARYSSLALISFVVVALSGLLNASVRLNSPIELLSTPYGALVAVKVVALTGIGLVGAVHRRRTLRRYAESGRQRWLWFLVTVELAVMGVASGVAVALARTEAPRTPVPVSGSASPAEILTGEALPPPPDLGNYLTQWRVDLLWVLLCGFGIVFYLVGVRRLRLRGDSWPAFRTVTWIAGLLVLLYLTNGGINLYERYLFSSHMLAHMALTMVVPLLLVPAAPVTLALRAIRRRTDGSRGGREWLLLAVHSRLGRLLASPLVAAGLFVASLWLFYYTPLFSWATTDYFGHQWMIVHFLITGYLFVQSLIGVDPVPGRLPYPLRLLVLLGTMAFHAIFGLTLMQGSGLLLADWYGAMGWPGSALVDQQTGGGIAWSVGEVPTVLLAVIVAIMWARSDARDSTRLDRAAERDNDADLTAYNSMLDNLTKRG